MLNLVLGVLSGYATPYTFPSLVAAAAAAAI